MKITTPVFNDNESIPETYTCDGAGINPELHIANVPEEAETLVLLMDDPDIPDVAAEQAGKPVWDHWVLFNIDAAITTIEEGSVPPDAVEGVNSGGDIGYQGPCPPDTEHRYFFKLYALDTALDLEEGCTKEDVEDAMNGHVIAQAELVGVYNRPQNR